MSARHKARKLALDFLFEGDLRKTDPIKLFIEREKSPISEFEYAKELILAAAPEYKQRNAALGLLDQTETDVMKQAIQDIRAISNSKEAEILAVVWDGTEPTRAAACDAVQAVRWD